MPLYMDIHEHLPGLSAEAVAGAHARDVEVGPQHNVDYKKYWYNVKTGTIFCLVEAPSPELASQVHREAHGLVADQIWEVIEVA